MFVRRMLVQMTQDHIMKLPNVCMRKPKNSIYINQYFNELNIDAHYRSTGPEIWNQTNGQITHLVACSGTGGTISGTARYLKEQNPEYQRYWSGCLWFGFEKIS